MVLKGITAKDPRKAPAVAALKKFSNTRSVTQVVHDTGNDLIIGRCFNRGRDVGTGIGYYAVTAEGLHPHGMWESMADYEKGKESLVEVPELDGETPAEFVNSFEDEPNWIGTEDETIVITNTPCADTDTVVDSEDIEPTRREQVSEIAIKAMTKLSPLGASLTLQILRIFKTPGALPKEWAHEPGSLVVGVPMSAGNARSISILEKRGIFRREDKQIVDSKHIWVTLGPLFGDATSGQITVKEALAAKNEWGPFDATQQKELDMAARKTATKKANGKANGKAKAKAAPKAKAPRKSKVDVSELNPKGMLRKNAKGKWAWEPGRDATYASVLKKIARGDGSKVEQTFAFQKYFVDNEKVQASAHLQHLIKDAKKGARA